MRDLTPLAIGLLAMCVAAFCGVMGEVRHEATRRQRDAFKALADAEAEKAERFAELAAVRHELIDAQARTIRALEATIQAQAEQLRELRLANQVLARVRP